MTNETIDHAFYIMTALSTVLAIALAISFWWA
jgi:hypothetical protein